MLPASLAFAWALWRQHGAGFLLAVSYLLAVGAVSAVFPTHCSPDIAKVVVGLFCWSVLALAMCLLLVFSYGAESADVLARESCFPARLFRLPVRTGSLVVWPLVYGAAAAILLWLISAGFVLRPWLARFDETVPLYWPALLATAFLAWVQALLWSPFGLRGLRVLVLVALYLGVVTLGSYAVDVRASEGFLAPLFGSLTVVGWTVAYVGVLHARRGDVPDWEALLWPLRQLGRWRPQRRLPFASAAAAQVWFEWRLTGNSLPFMTGLVLPFALLFLAFGKNEVMSTAQTLLGALTIPVFLAGLAAGWPGDGHNPWVKDRAGMMPFVATLPLTDVGLVAALLKTAVLSTLAAWAVLVVMVPLAVGLTGNLEEVVGWWRDGLHEHGPVQIAAGVGAAATLLLAWTWKRRVDSLYLGLTGRTWFDSTIGLVCIPGSVALWFLAAWIWCHPETHEITLIVLPWLLGVLVLGRLLAAGWALRQVLRQGLLGTRTVACWVASWLLLASVLIGVLAWVVPPGLVPVYYLVFGVLLALPATRLAASPLALAWNRHR